jgi:hypothetical protein
MLKELLILVGLFGFMFFFIPALAHPSLIDYDTGMFPFFAFIILLAYSAFRFKTLLENHKRNQAISFLVALVATVIIGFVIILLVVPPTMGFL